VSEEEIGALTSLGLTLVQSKVFLALSKLHCAPINRVSEVSMVPRQDIYRVVFQLQELSLVQKALKKPVEYQAVPMEEACSILLNRKKEEYLRLREIQKRFLHSFKNQSCAVERQDNEFLVVKGKEAIFKCIEENFVKSKERIDIATTLERFLQSINYLGLIYKEKLQGGVAYRVITEKPADEKAFLTQAEDIIRHPNFELKYVCSPVRAIAVIFDGKSALAAMQVDEALLKSPIIYTNNNAFLAIFSEYFAQVWSKGAYYRQKKTRFSGQNPRGSLHISETG
jgi:sugar-specific transcriptional regulator TrmB